MGKKEKAKERSRERERAKGREKQRFKKDQKNKNDEKTRKGAKKVSEKGKTSMDATQGKGKRLYQDRNEKRRKMMLIH